MYLGVVFLSFLYPDKDSASMVYLMEEKVGDIFLCCFCGGVVGYLKMLLTQQTAASIGVPYQVSRGDEMGSVGERSFTW